MLAYTLSPNPDFAHTFDVQLEIELTNVTPIVELVMPTWIAGSYLIREFSRHIHQLRAFDQQKQALRLEKISKNRWQLHNPDGKNQLILQYQFFAHDLSVRGSWLEDDRIFLNPANFCIYPEGQPNSPVHLNIAALLRDDWTACTTLKKLSAGKYQAQSVNDFIERPIAIAKHQIFDFNVNGIAHRLAISSTHAIAPEIAAKIACDTQKICQTQHDFFQAQTPTWQQSKQYLFLLHIEPEQYGGLEHLDCTALLAPPSMLPKLGEVEAHEGYLDLLGLISHEYFHTWNVKSIRPAAFCPPERELEGYSRLLWAFEGITAYYDDLLVLRAGLATRAQYLQRFAKSLSRLKQAPADKIQTLEEASFDTWIKFYRPHENAPNVHLNYYLKGALAATYLDLTIRARSQHQQSLDDFMRHLAQRAAQNPTWQMAEKEWENLATKFFNFSLSDCFDKILRSTESWDWRELLSTQALQILWRAPKNSDDLGEFLGSTELKQETAPAFSGLKLAARAEGGGLRVEQVLAASPAQVAGLAVGDILLALDGEKLNTREQFFQLLSEDRMQSLHFFRRSRLLQAHIRASTASATAACLRDLPNQHHLTNPPAWPLALPTS